MQGRCLIKFLLMEPYHGNIFSQLRLPGFKLTALPGTDIIILLYTAEKGGQGNGMRKFCIRIMSLLATVFTGTALWAVIQFPGQPPVLLQPSTEAVALAEELMDAVCSGDFERAETMLYGQPELGVDRQPAEVAGTMIWNAYVNSLDYELMGELYATDRGLAQDVKIIFMVLPTVTANLSTRTRQLLNEAIAAAEDVSELYDEKNEYREDLVMDILHRAVAQALEEDVRYSYRVVQLQLVYRDGQWKAVADRAFLDAISGGISE